VSAPSMRLQPSALATARAARRGRCEEAPGVLGLVSSLPSAALVFIDYHYVIGIGARGDGMAPVATATGLLTGSVCRRRLARAYRPVKTFCRDSPRRLAGGKR